jgi:hypothetical protein
MNEKITRRRFVAGSAAAATAIASVNILTRRAEAAEFTYKYANNSPLTHPMTIRMTEAAAKIKDESKGRLEIQIFPNNQLGGDTDMLSQVRSGAIDFFTLSGLILATLVPVASINGIGFAWKSYDQIWPAMDGELGAHVRAAIAKSGLVAFDRRRSQGLQDPRPAEPALDLDVQGVRRRAGEHQFQRGLFGAADQDRRGPGEPALDHRNRQALRSAEVSRDDQSHVGRVLVPRQRQVMGRAA